MHAMLKKHPYDSVMNDAAKGRNSGDVPVPIDANAASSYESPIRRPVA